MSPVTTSSSQSVSAPANLQSIATISGIAVIHAFVIGAILLRQKKAEERERNDNINKNGSCKTKTECVTEKNDDDSNGELIADFSTCLVVTLPEWTTDFYSERKNNTYKSQREMMQVAMELSKINVQKNTGGPFGTAIFEYDPKTENCKLFSIGVNRVVPSSNSTLHGEMTAIQFGQQKAGSFSFSSAGAKSGKEYHLYTSCAPCCQCLGATMWSGVSKLVCGATKADAEAIGFSEGPVFDPQSYDALEEAGCKVVREVLRDECKDVLDWYGMNGEIYNP